MKMMQKLMMLAALTAAGCGSEATPADRDCGVGMRRVGGSCVSTQPTDEPPAAWTCDAGRFAGGDACDCGCGALDPDCPTPLVLAACEQTSCPAGEAPDPSDPTHCLSPLEGWSCPASYFGDGSCDCGCTTVDQDCTVPLTLAECAYADACDGLSGLDPNDPTRCKSAPSGWTCTAAYFGDGTCDCGCGIVDQDCALPLTLAACDYADACGGLNGLDPTVPTRCKPVPSGWSCSLGQYEDGTTCDCGCGIADPDCPSPLRVQSCDANGCSYGEGPDPVSPVTCTAGSPVSTWSCDMSLLYDGATCDCGCGALDPDCPAGATVASCTAVHCTGGTVPDEADLGACIEQCVPATGVVGTATCTNGGEFEVNWGGALYCTDDLSACSDGHRYEVECGDGWCSCRVDGGCVARVAGYCGYSVASTMNTACGWHLIDAR